MESLDRLRAEQAALETLLKGRRRTEAQWQRSDGSWWEHGPDGKVRRAKKAGGPPSSGEAERTPTERAHHHLQQAEAALREAGHHGHADAVAKLRERAMDGGAAKPVATKRDWSEHDPLMLIQQGGPEAMRSFMGTLSTKEKRAYLKAYNLVNSETLRGGDSALIQAGVEAATSKHRRMSQGRMPDRAADFDPSAIAAGT